MATIGPRACICFRPDRFAIRHARLVHDPLGRVGSGTLAPGGLAYTQDVEPTRQSGFADSSADFVWPDIGGVGNYMDPSKVARSLVYRHPIPHPRQSKS